jgi:hypothetical protein
VTELVSAHVELVETILVFDKRSDPFDKLRASGKRVGRKLKTRDSFGSLPLWLTPNG